MFIFGDESGDFKFRRGTNISNYFVLSTVRMAGCNAGHELLDLRRHLKRKGVAIGDMFHAATDPNTARTEVFAIIKKSKFSIDSTLLEKPKAEPQTRSDEATFYKYAWFYHGKFLATQVMPKHEPVYLSAAALETKGGAPPLRLRLQRRC